MPLTSVRQDLTNLRRSSEFSSHGSRLCVAMVHICEMVCYAANCGKTVGKPASAHDRSFAHLVFAF
jgi:hypothetical protein